MSEGWSACRVWEVFLARMAVHAIESIHISMVLWLQDKATLPICFIFTHVDFYGGDLIQKV